MHRLARINDALERAEVLLCQGLVIFLIFVVFLQVLARFVLKWGVLWTLEASLLSFVWTVMLGSALGVRRGLHYTIDILPKDHPVARTFCYGGILVLALVFAVSGTVLAISEWKRFSQPSMIRITFFVACIPVMGVTSVLFIVERILRDLSGRRQALKGTST